MAETDRTKKFFDTLLQNYDILTKAMEQASERGLKLSKQFVTDATKRQREAIELAAKAASEPNNHAANFAAIMQATVAAQSQALEFTQLIYKEAVSAGAEAREVGEALMSASREAAEAALELSQDWTTSNPFAELFQQGMEAFAAATPNGKTTKTKAEASAS